MRIKNIIIGSALLLLGSSCSNFLDEFSQTYIRASKVSDYDELLLGSVYVASMNPQPPYSYGIPGGSSCDFFNYLDDDMNTVEEASLSMSGGLPYVQWLDMSRVLFGYSAWQQDITQTMLDDHDDSSTWVDLYQRIAILNTCLDELGRLDVTTEAEIEDKNRVLGECHFLRAQFYLILANLYGKPYNPETASTDLGVPLKTSSGVEHDKDKETQFERTPLNEIYAQIVNDLRESITLLAGNSKGVLYRASEEAAAVLLSRVYLYMQEWENAKNVIEPYLTENKLMLSSIVPLESFVWNTPFLTKENSEIIFSQGSLYSEMTFTANSPDFCVSRELYNLYDDKDVRKTCFTINTRTDSIALSFKYRTDFHQSRVSDIFTIRAAEAYLNMAEACAMMGGQDALANQYLNTLRRNRIIDYVDQSYSGEELVSQIRNERRKELCFEGHRWFDLRRYSVSNPYPYSKRIYRRYSVYTSDYVLEQTYTYVLEENDPAYVFDIPKSVKEFDVVPMPGNDRPVRNSINNE